MPMTTKTLRVLIVDDHRDGADSLGLVVEELGHNAHVTYGGRQALEVATVFRPDLILVDLAMPEMDGCHLVERFRQLPASAHTKIVAITGHTDEGHKTLAMKAGFDAILFKPVALIDIETTLASIAPVVGLRDQSPRPPERGNLGSERRYPLAEHDESGANENRKPR
jgi:CheY-like chemotaxis protein